LKKKEEAKTKTQPGFFAIGRIYSAASQKPPIVVYRDNRDDPTTSQKMERGRLVSMGWLVDWEEKYDK